MLSTQLLKKKIEDPKLNKFMWDFGHSVSCKSPYTNKITVLNKLKKILMQEEKRSVKSTNNHTYECRF